jgi:hypothetical protein
MSMNPRERIPYSAIVDRALRPPDGARMILLLIVNVENWDARRSMPRTALPAHGHSAHSRSSELVLALIRNAGWLWADTGLS